MAEWTPSQLKVIQSDAKEIICSAAAGSGKTAVMVERIIRFLRNGAEPSGFLVVTFTNAAASEMKEKIRKRLLEEKHHPMIRNALDQMDMMQISTIHSFCQQLLKNQFQLAEIDPNFQICEPSLQARFFHEAFMEACDCLAKQNDPFYYLLRQRFESKQAEQIIQTLHPFIMSLSSPFEWLENQINLIPDEPDESHPWFLTLNEMAEDQMRMGEILLARMEEMLSDPCAIASFRDLWNEDLKLFHVKQSEILSHPAERTKSRFERMKPQKGLTVQESDWKDRYQKIRNDYKKQIGRVDELLMTDPEKTISEWKNMRESLIAIRMLLEETEKLFKMKKRARDLMDFQDLEQETVRILSDPTGCEEARSTWRYIFVDECQDISEVQNQIISLLQSEENHLFMVGDVKQSIYRFRLADPSLFLNRIRSVREQASQNRECIYLQSNFRSRPEILEATNMVFRSVMKESVTEISYGPEEELIPGRKVSGFEPVHIEIIRKGDRDTDSLEDTADFLAKEINFLLKEKYEEKNRYYQYRDCVILMPAVHTEGPKLAELLEDRNIPVFFDGSGDYYQLHEIQIIRNLLEWIDYPLQDLPLLSVLQNPPFSFTDEELSLIRLKVPDRDLPFHEAFSLCAEEASDLGEKCRYVLEKLHSWQNMAEIMHVSELIWELYRDTGIYYILGVEPAGDVSQANLRMLAEQAAEAETRGVLTLRDFLSYMRDQQDYGDQQSATLLGEQDNLVRMMTVHKSKGLQFPVVFCAGMDKSPWGTDSGGVRYHAQLGICVNYKDPEHRISRPTLADDLFAWRKKREEMAEKVRLLYVAMTRAQEKLYLLTCQEASPLWSMPEADGRILAARSFTDWWMPVFLQQERKKISTECTQPENPYEIRFFDCNQQKTVEKSEDIHSLSAWLESVISAPFVENLWKKETEKKDPSTLVKRSVTSLIRSARKKVWDEPLEETAEQKRMPDLLARKLKESEIAEMPAFMRETGQITAAWRGTMTHRILSTMDLDQIRQGKTPEEVLREEKNRMLREHMASEKELQLVDDKQIAVFWKSEIGKRILRSPEIHREWNFNLLIRREEQMILQGVIDLAFREGDEWVILDYKTDRGKTAEQLAEEYRPQVLWYCKAVSELTGQKVKEAGLYSLSLDCLIPVLQE